MKSYTFGLLLTALSLFMPSAFACTPEADSSAVLLHCKVKLKSYPQPVHFYIPENADGNFAVHFHGHNLEGYNHFDKRFGDYGLYLSESKVTFSLIIPESLGKCSTYDTFFADQKRTEDFFAEAAEFLKTETGFAGHPVALSGHSGAYRVLNKLSAYANESDSVLSSIKGVGLFDAVYGDIPKIEQWVLSKKNQSFVFYSSFVTGNKATTEDLNLQLMKKLKGDNIYFMPVKGENQESLLDQHFMILKRGSLEQFWKKIP
jgi:hypothetical protein